MTAPRDIDSVLDSWMSDGPTIVADRVIAAALTEIPTTRQRGAGALRRYFTMTTLRPTIDSPNRRFLPLVAAAALLIAVVGVALIPRLIPVADDGPGLSNGVSFTSERYGYELTLPEGWSTHEVAGAWSYGAVALPGFPGTDQFRAPDTAADQANLYVWAAETPAGVTLAEFLEGWDAQVLTGLDCAAPPSHQSTTVDGVAARLSTSHCTADGAALNLRETVVVANGWVYVMAMDTDPAQMTDAEMDALYGGVIDSFRFTD